MTATVSKAVVGDFEAVVLSNAHLRAVIIPALGGRVWTLEDRRRARQWIWHRHGVPLTASAPDAVYDDVWAGGWEELFPNDAPGWFGGRQLPDHGEWWTMRWAVAATSSSGPTASVLLQGTSSVVNTTCSKEFLLAHDAPMLSVRYRIRSREDQRFHFLFKQHLPILLTPACRLLVPGGRVQAVDPEFGTILSDARPFDWPYARTHAGRDVDLRSVPEPSSGAREFLYLRDLPEPWCGVEDTRSRASIRMNFDNRKLPFLWLFLSYGGWRDTYMAVLEPCSNMPKDLTEAVRLQQAASLDPGEQFETVVSVTLAGPSEATT
jgi:hypothetical protein